MFYEHRKRDLHIYSVIPYWANYFTEMQQGSLQCSTTENKRRRLRNETLCHQTLLSLFTLHKVTLPAPQIDTNVNSLKSCQNQGSVNYKGIVPHFQKVHVL